MRNRGAQIAIRPRTPTPAEVEAAGAWEQVERRFLVFDFERPAAEASAPLPLEWSKPDSGGLREAVLRWLEQQM